MRPTVLILSTYPLDTPRHGGQIRLAQLKKNYESAGWIVYSVACYESEAYALPSQDQVSKPDELENLDALDSSVHLNILMPEGDHRLFKGRYVPFSNDLLSGQYAAHVVFSQVQDFLPEHLDLIHVEQPWMWPVAKKIKSLPPYRQAILIYGSQNIEAMLKKNILNHFGVVDTELVAAVHELEMCAAQEANVCLAVTDVDLEVLRGYGAQQLVLAPNGIEPWGVKETQLNDWRERLPSGPWILYVASDHPPNVTGFITYMGEALGCIPPNAQLVIAGAVSSSLEAYLRAATWGEFNVSRMQVLGVLSEEDLAAVKTLAHAFLLPIEQRSGSNLKTAEALYSGAYVVGTDIAFRGYERYLHLPRVYIAKTPQDFRYMIGQVLRKPKITLQLSELDDDREFLTWRHCLSQATDVIKNFLKG